MSNGTLKSKSELIALLADNNVKAISAVDVQSIVKSNYQPVMIFTGALVRDEGSGRNTWNIRTNYYNPDFFWPRSSGVGLLDRQQIWRFRNRGGGLIANHTYTNVEVRPTTWVTNDTNPLVLAPTTSAYFNIYTDAAGSVDSYDVLSSGSGWWGVNGTRNNSGDWTYPGQLGTMPSLAGSGITLPSIEFVGPVVWKNGQGSNVTDARYVLSTNSNSPTANVPGQGASSTHSFLNTLVQHSLLEGKGEQYFNPGMHIEATSTNPNNSLYVQGIRSNTSDAAMQVTIWRLPT